MFLTESGGQLSVGLIFWLLMILWLIFGFVWYWPRAGSPATPFYAVGGHTLIFVLFLLLGLAVFGWPIR